MTSAAVDRRAGEVVPAPNGKPRVILMMIAPNYVIAAANAFVGLDLTAGAQRAFGGPPSVAERFLHEVGAILSIPIIKRTRPRLPSWDAAFIQHVGYWALYGGDPPRSRWPLPPTCNAHELSQVAGHQNLLVGDPRVGDLYLLWSDAKRRFVRTGIVTKVTHERTDVGVVRRCQVIEGSTSRERAHRGGLVLRLERRVGKRDLFVRWSDPLDPRAFNLGKE